jgi:hypothetical protein
MQTLYISYVQEAKKGLFSNVSEQVYKTAFYKVWYFTQGR